MKEEHSTGRPEVTGSEREYGYDTAEEDESPEEGVPVARKRADQHLLNKMEHKDDDDEAPPDWLCALEGKSGQLVCWEFAKTGKCSWMEKNGKCQFSHKPEDVEYWRAANALGKDGVTNLYRNTHV